MSLWLGLRRVSQSFNTLIRHRSLAHRHFTAQSCSRRVLFLAERRGGRYFYSAKIEKNGTLGPATMLPPIPSKIHLGLGSLWSRSAFLNGKIFIHLYQKFIGPGEFSTLHNHLHIYSPDTGEDYTLPDVPVGSWHWKYYNSCYFGFDTVSNEHMVLLVQNLPDSQDPWNRLFWVFTRGSGSWSQIHSLPPEQIVGFPKDLPELVFANGAFHCIVYGDSHLSSTSFPSTPEKYILAFDMVEGQHRKIPFPDDSFPGKLTQFGGRLALIENFPLKDQFLSPVFLEASDDVEYDKLQLWILEDYNNHKWVKETIHLPFGWMRYKYLLAFNYNTGEMLLQPRCTAEQIEKSRYATGQLEDSEDLRQLQHSEYYSGEMLQQWRCATGQVEDSEYFLYYNSKTGIFRRAEVTGLPHRSYDDIPLSGLIDVNFDDEMERQKSF